MPPEIIRISTELPVPLETVWELLQQTDTLRFVSRPLLQFTSARPLPERWSDGTHAVQLWFFGVVPLGRQELRVSRERDGDGWILRDDGRGQLAKRWDHHIHIQPGPSGTTHYTDTIEVEAGWLTPLVRAFAALFYRHRQRRWHRLVRQADL